MVVAGERRGSNGPNDREKIAEKSLCHQTRHLQLTCDFFGWKNVLVGDLLMVLVWSPDELSSKDSASGRAGYRLYSKREADKVLAHSHWPQTAQNTPHNEPKPCLPSFQPPARGAIWRGNSSAPAHFWDDYGYLR